MESANIVKVQEQSNADKIDDVVSVEVKDSDIASDVTKPEWQNVQSFQGASFNSLVVNIINTIIGAGILSIAYSIKLAGVLGSVILILCVLVPSLMTAYYMACATVYTNESVYGVVGTRLSNRAVGFLADLSVVLLDIGICVAYMNVLFSQVVDVLGEFISSQKDFFDNNKNAAISVIVSLLVLFPLCSIKNMDSLKFTSTIVVICVVIFVIACIYLGIVGWKIQEIHMWPVQGKDLTTALAVFILCFCCHLNIPKMVSELKYTSTSKFSSKLKKVNKATIVAYVACALSYFFVGICGYLAFGEAVQGSLLDSLRDVNYWFKPIIKIGYGLVVMFSYPILGYPGCCTIDAYLFASTRTTTRRIIEALGWVVVTLIFAILIPQLTSIFGIIGSLSGCLIVFVWPSFYYICMFKKENAKPVEMRVTWMKQSRVSYYSAWIIFVIGIVVCIFATFIEIQKVISPN